MAHGSNPPGGGEVGEYPILPPGMALRASHFSPVLDRSDDREDGPHPFSCRMSSWERKRHEPRLAKNCSLWTVSRLSIRASVLQRSQLVFPISLYSSPYPCTFFPI